MPAVLKTALLSLLALAGALVVLALVTSAASWLPALLGLQPAGNGAQLGWDLAFTVLGGTAATAFSCWYAPCWPRAQGTAIWLLIAAASVWACLDMGQEFPRWFVIALLLSLPLQLAAGLWLGTRRAHRRPDTARV